MAGTYQPTRSGRQFSLRGLLIFVMVLCVALGYWAARRQAVDGMISRHDALFRYLLDQGLVNIDAGIVHHEIEFVGSDRGRQEDIAKSHILSSNRADHRRAAILSTGASAWLSRRGHMYQFPPSASQRSPEQYGRAILDHYTGQLARLGFRRNMSGSKIPGDGSYGENEIWTTKNNEFVVEFNVRVDTEAQTAKIEIFVVESQPLRVW